MNDAYRHIFSLLDSLIEYTTNLHHCLIREKKALIEFNIDELNLLNLKKESLISAIVRKKKEITEYLKIRFNVSKFSEFNNVVDKASCSEWMEKYDKWQTVWNHTKETCEINQKFLKRSLNNLSFLIENFKKAFGRFSLYNVKGKRKDLEFSEYLISA